MNTVFSKVILTVSLTLGTSFAWSQTTEAEEKLRKIENPDSTIGWKKGGIVNIGFSQVSLTNWAAGGQSSVAVNGLISVFAHRTYKKGIWENFLDLGYGILRQGETGAWLKTDDRIDFASKYGQKLSKNMYFAGLTNFKTQWTDGFDPKDLTQRISTFMAPGYWITAIGLEFKPSKEFSLFLAPFTSKNTFVLDEEFSSVGAFGVEPGKQFRGEFGGYLRMNYTKDVMENVNLKTRLDLFSNYLNKPQNIDVNWEMLISMKVNKFITATLGTNLVYDHDILIRTSTGDGPRTQFKQMLSVGFGYKFKK
jgi:hypothetical protein